MRIVYLNGPPKSGKDEIGNFLRQHYDATVLKHTTPMDRALTAFLDMTESEYGTYRNKLKDVPINTQWSENHSTMRQALIELSERWAKPVWGKHILGNLNLKAVRRLDLRDKAKLVVMTDCGFDYEVEPVVKAYGAENVLLVHIHRDGCTYDGDSRSYIEMDGVTTVELYNDIVGLDMLHARVKKVIVPWISQ